MGAECVCLHEPDSSHTRWQFECEALTSPSGDTLGPGHEVHLDGPTFPKSMENVSPRAQKVAHGILKIGDLEVSIWQLS